MIKRIMVCDGCLKEIPAATYSGNGPLGWLSVVAEQSNFRRLEDDPVYHGPVYSAEPPSQYHFNYCPECGEQCLGIKAKVQ